MENKEAAFVCTKCGAEVNFCDVDQCLCHTVFIFYATGEVMSCGPCGPCKIKTEWALAHMAKQEADLMSSASHISALEAQLAEMKAAQKLAVDNWTLEAQNLKVAENKLTSIVLWLERYQPDVFQRGLWDALNA